MKEFSVMNSCGAGGGGGSEVILSIIDIRTIEYSVEWRPLLLMQFLRLHTKTKKEIDLSNFGEGAATAIFIFDIYLTSS